jgi:hypothetical protein
MTENREDMRRTRDNSNSLSEAERHLVDQIDTHYRPRSMDFQQRAAFDRKLRARTQRDWAWSRSWGWGAGLAAAAAALLWILLPGSEHSTEPQAGDLVAEELLHRDSGIPREDVDSSRSVPTQAIAQAAADTGIETLEDELNADPGLAELAYYTDQSNESDWSDELLDEQVEIRVAQDTDYLPEDYLAIASVLLGQDV